MGKIYVDSSTTKLEFITAVAKDCLANLKETDKEYLIKHPFAVDYHFSYGLYIRNNYIHNNDFSKATFYVEPDNMSGDILEMIFSIIVPDYEYKDSFTEELFGHEQYVHLREQYLEKYGHYPTEILDKYRDNFNQIYDAVMGDRLDLEIGSDDWHDYIKYIIKVANQLMSPVIEELKEKLEA